MRVENPFVKESRGHGVASNSGTIFEFASARLRVASLALVLFGWISWHAGELWGAVESTPEGIRFSYRSTTASEVFVAGEFNAWNGAANRMTRQGDEFSAIVELGPGEHEYKFVVDGNWLADPDNPATVGAYGNSVIRVGARGELLEVEATSNTSLSPKILLGGRYIGLFIGREDEANQDRFAVDRPDFNIDLDFKIRVSEALDARVLTKIRNETQETPLWETSLRFDRGHLDLNRPQFNIRVFDNDGVGTWDDPLHLVGDIGRYRRDFGFNQQGVRAIGESFGFRGEFIYADNFESKDPTFPPPAALPADVNVVTYGFSNEASNRNMLALRLQKELQRKLRIAALLRNDRGYHPGSFSRVTLLSDSTSTREVFPQTNERWMGGGIDVRWAEPDDALGAFAEFLYGEAWIALGEGTRQLLEFTVEGDTLTETLLESVPLGGRRETIDISSRWTLGVHGRPLDDVSLRASLEYERHALAPIFSPSRQGNNSAFVYRFGFDVDGEKRFKLPIRMGLGLEVFDFSYPEDALWNTQLWFADRNFWMEHAAHELPVSRYTQLGGGDATTWSPWLEATLWKGPPLVFRYQGHFRGQEIDEDIELWESVFGLEYPLSRAWRLYSQTRWVRYDDPGLGIDGGYVATFAEVEYKFSPTVSVALSYGVDPFVLDEVTNEYDEIGINEFLVEAGATPERARDLYGILGSRFLPQAEQLLEDERRIQLEAIVVF